MKGQADLIYRGGKFFLLATADLPDKAPIEIKDFLGVDLGIVNAVNADNAPLAEEEPAGDVIFEYCTVVRGILNDDQGGPLHPCGLRMAEALGEVRHSIQRNVVEKKGGSQRSNPTLGRLHRQGLGRGQT